MKRKSKRSRDIDTNAFKFFSQFCILLVFGARPGCFYKKGSLGFQSNGYHESRYGRGTRHIPLVKCGFVKYHGTPKLVKMILV